MTKLSITLSLPVKAVLIFSGAMSLPLMWFFIFDGGLKMFKHPGLAATFFFFTAFSMGLIYLWALRLGRQLDNFSERVQRLGKGQSAHFYGMDSKGELGRLAASLNTAAESLQSRIRDLTTEKDKFEKILDSMVEGVLAFDALGRIMLLNRAAEKMLHIYFITAHNRLLVEVVRHHQLDAALTRTLNTGEPVVAELRLWAHQPNTYRVQVVPVADEAARITGAIMVIQDITELRRLEQMRSEFVANVSHELKTPLTSIKGFVETLQDGALEQPEVAQRFLGIISDETKRLQRLIEDLLNLSRIESRRENLEDESDLATEIYRVVNLLEAMAAEKLVHVQVDIESDLPKAALSSDHANQLLMNLIENAIKYNRPGGLVIIKASQKDDKLLLSVSDTGIGIPSESLSRIFERFYRVDKARSREIGGTGLGLAIVKHIVEGAEGRIEAESQIGKGSVFTIRLPLAKVK